MFAITSGAAGELRGLTDIRLDDESVGAPRAHLLERRLR
jgi:hypothetical protein